jgi:hypothetical protein
MKMLTLPLKKKWFDMIKAGVKKEEYRECSEFWISRFIKDFRIHSDFRFEMCFRGGKFLTDYLISDVQDCLNSLDFDSLVFTLGYPKADDTERRLEFNYPKIRIGTGRHEWGAEPGKMYFVITWEAV